MLPIFTAPTPTTEFLTKLIKLRLLVTPSGYGRPYGHYGPQCGYFQNQHHRPGGFGLQSGSPFAGGFPLRLPFGGCPNNVQTVPQPYPVPVDQPIPVPFPQPVPIPVDRPYPVQVPRPIPVPVSRPYPVPVDRPVPVPVPVVVDRPGLIGGNNNFGYGFGSYRRYW